MKDYFDLTGQVAVVTGVSTDGFGLQMSKALASKGANLVLLARRLEPLQKNAEAIEREFGVKTLAIACDVGDSEQVNEACRKTMETFGRVDILINNAGMNGGGPAEDVPDEVFERVVDIDLLGVFRCCKAFGKEMLKAGYGRVINIASMLGLVGTQQRAPEDVNRNSAYHAAKGGVVNYTRSLAGEWARRGVTVNSICPGFFVTDLNRDRLTQGWFKEYAMRFTPMGRYGESGELDTCVLFLASKHSSFITGQNIAIDGGYTAI